MIDRRVLVSVWLATALTVVEPARRAALVGRFAGVVASVGR